MMPAPSATSAPRFPLVFVLGCAHCGSTLLGRLLNRHSRILCVGELMRLDKALADDLPCSCGARVPECAFWKPLLPELGAGDRRRSRRFTPDLYRRIAGRAGREVVVDLSKTRIWRQTRWWRNRGEGYILLVRDSRGNLASALRSSKDLPDLLRKHRKWMRRLLALARRRRDRTLLLHYEDLCLQPGIELRRVCQFLGIAFEESMLRPADQEHHFVDSSVSGYLKGSSEIRLDERWRRELSPEILERIEAVMSRVPLLRDRYLRR